MFCRFYSMKALFQLLIWTYSPAWINGWPIIFRFLGCPDAVSYRCRCCFHLHFPIFTENSQLNCFMHFNLQNYFEWCNCTWYCYANIPGFRALLMNTTRIALQVSRSYSNIKISVLYNLLPHNAIASFGDVNWWVCTTHFIEYETVIDWLQQFYSRQLNTRQISINSSILIHAFNDNHNLLALCCYCRFFCCFFLFKFIVSFIEINFCSHNYFGLRGKNSIWINLCSISEKKMARKK